MLKIDVEAPIKQMVDVLPRTVGTRNDIQEQKALHAGCICIYGSIDSTTNKSVRVYN